MAMCCMQEDQDTKKKGGRRGNDIPWTTCYFTGRLWTIAHGTKELGQKPKVFLAFSRNGNAAAL